MSGETTSPDDRYLFSTPTEQPPDCYAVRRLSIPDRLDYKAVVNGALSMLLQEGNWRQSEGGLSVEETVQIFMHLWLDYLGEYDLMIGAVVPMIVDVLPVYMLWCDGAQYNRLDFPELYGSLPPEFIDDVLTFHVPDLRGLMIVGSGTNGVTTERAIGDTGGAETVTLTTDQIPAHRHGIYTAPLLQGISSGDPNHVSTQNVVPVDETADAGGGQAHNNMPPFMALRFAVVAKSRDAC